MAGGSRYVQFAVADATVVVEVDAPTGTEPVGVADAIADAGATLEAAFAKVGQIVTTMRAKMQQAIADAERVEVEFGVKFSGELGLILAKSSVEANLQVTVTWKR